MTRSRPEQIWIGGGALASVLVAAAAWFFFVSPELSNASSLRAQTASTRASNDALRSTIDQLKQERANLAGLQQSLASARAALPGDSGLAEFTQQVNAQAQATHISVTSIAAGTPAPVTARSTTTPPAKASAAPATAAGQLIAIPVTVVVDGSPGGDLAFLHAVQAMGPRAALLSSATLAAHGGAGSKGQDVTLTLQMQVFVAPQAASGQG